MMLALVCVLCLNLNHSVTELAIPRVMGVQHMWRTPDKTQYNHVCSYMYTHHTDVLRMATLVVAIKHRLDYR